MTAERFGIGLVLYLVGIFMLDQIRAPGDWGMLVSAAILGWLFGAFLIAHKIGEWLDHQRRLSAGPSK